MAVTDPPRCSSGSALRHGDAHLPCRTELEAHWYRNPDGTKAGVLLCPRCDAQTVELVRRPRAREPSEDDRVTAWRHECLVAAWWPPLQAEMLAAAHDIDLHHAVGLLENGCTVEQAWEILT